ncbi:bifunctional UDP-N-acetylmuramoyl-tripeptide:D-alanyl-D-alanine ligase/alanine racemase [Arachidicoccus ginsenosidimutans]|uniref:bifunctional UDP-N-acetylmuramoyl-tripeptide:D-alanyl-D-alanine ligase/alanine racemase n=1 Tax=Arachidicoccus sp. BS20 TaxID=1850526 RepID=UPI0007F05C18|nr:bifunctional UDP-N-acetylmuramoyl-tripeptide:D-alanyl-D-alanine ligase/alanine racemase [Arachidicoccus sp. BS20]ANI90032.1 bifunctional UDP-N-acetylmuramoyl-tripeptide:D-alanyl-D-alanine ligase/alanine racemase [Arachidicoccus sp. BS20]
MYPIQSISEIIEAESLFADKEIKIEHLITDSRRITFAASSLFFAIKTEHRNGADFVEEAYRQGIRNFVLQENIDTGKYKDANFLFVKNTLASLQKLAAFHRLQFHYPVIGITGSNGKTIVKEWLNFLLNDDYKIIRSPRSYNSQIGVPLSVWEMGEEDNLGIFEAGISEVNKMENLEKIIQPEIGIFTNLGDAHEKGFTSKQQKLEEKIKLFQHSKIVFANADDEQIISTLKKKTSAQILSYGKNQQATLKIIDIKKEQRQTTVVADYQAKEISITIPFIDDASLQNACVCWLAAIYLNIDEKIIQQKMLQLPVIDMRLQVLPAINNCTIINDSYSLDIDSLSVGLDLLNQQLLSKTLILSDFHNDDERIYQSAINILVNKKINRLIIIGKNWQQYQTELKNKIAAVETYSTSNDFINHFQPNHFKNEAILLKGARCFHFEELLNLLIQKVHQTRLEINLSNIVHNLKEYRKHLKPTTKVMAMVKAFAYGSGSIEIASILQYHKIDYLTVAYADEGVELRNAGINIPIMVMNTDEYGFETIVQHNLEPEIYSFKILNEFAVFLQKQGVAQFPVHLKIDTGMHRLGFEESQMDDLIAGLKANKSLVIKSVFSHLVGSEDAAEDDFTKKQTDIFIRCCAQIENALQYKFIRHISNSAAIIRHPEIQFDMVRLGIGLYGVNYTPEKMDLKVVASLKTTIAQIKHEQPGDSVGYNQKGKINKPTTTATIRIGYADGYNRRFSNGAGFVLINNQPAKVIGNVAMDMTMVDITDIPNVKEGDDVEVFGENLPVQKLAKQSGTIAYEIFTSVGQRVKRVYVEE